MDSAGGAIVYIIVKFMAYAAWSYFGLRQLRTSATIGTAAKFGFVRLLLGIFFGVSVFVAGAMLHLNVPAHPYLLYLSIYAPVRYLEWSILAWLLLNSSERSCGYANARTQLWVLGGIVVSHLADLPMILLSCEGAKGFLPVGRFLC